MNLSTLSPTNQAMSLLLKSLGQTSDSIRLGFERGFDSGEMMDRIYQNQPSGRYGLGWLCDWAYLNQIGCKGLRGRKALLKETLRTVIDAQRQAGQCPVILDFASGPANYLVEVLAELRDPGVQAIARDLDKNGLRRGEALAKAHGLTNIKYQFANAFDLSSLWAVRPQPTIVVASGFYEILLDDVLISRSMRLARQVLPEAGTFIFTTQVNHPQLELIKALPNRNGDSWVMKNRPVELVEGWARAAGFQHVTTRLEPHGLFSVSVAS